MRVFSLLTAVSALTVSLLALSSAAHADVFSDDRSLNMDYLTFSAGEYDVRDHLDKQSLELGVDYRFHQWDFGIRPVIGLHTNTNGMLYGYGGINWDVPLPVLENRLYLTPSVVGGLYSHNGSGNLGGTVEFREGIELSYRFDNEQRLGVAYYHTSNADIYDRNPGVESLLLNYSIPVGSLR